MEPFWAIFKLNDSDHSDETPEIMSPLIQTPNCKSVNTAGRFVLLVVSFAFIGCGRAEISEDDRTSARTAKLEEIKSLKDDKSLAPQVRRDLIQRAELELKELEPVTK